MVENTKNTIISILKNNKDAEFIKVTGLGNTWIKGSFSILDEKSKKRLKFVEQDVSNVNFGFPK